ncbi:MAG: DNA internalization-related competence protein ComEC/Rec2 [Gemmatimonadota bacterium]|nr:MAG: DNA internalization-related competence protein ComEC/Rec2 [Gemmatimonadota bacterium]
MTKRRPPRPRPLALAALALAGGITTGLQGRSELLAPAAATAVGLCLAAVLLDRRDWLHVAALSCVAVGGLSIGAGAQARSRTDCRDTWEAGDRVQVIGVAVSFLPGGEQGSVRLQPWPAASGESCRWDGNLRIWAEGPVRPGSSYEVRGVWQLARTPGSVKRRPERRGWVSAFDLTEVAPAELRKHPFLTVRGTLAEKLWRAYPRRWAPLAEALVLGQRETLSPEIQQRIARAGLAHLLAISGLHVGMLAAAAFALARMARVPVHASRVMTLLVTTLYVLLIGAPESAVRAALIVALWVLARLAGRASSPFDALGLAALTLLLIRPWSVLEPGFLLSFGGAAAVSYAYREVVGQGWLRERAAPIRGIAVSLLTSLATVLLVAPITATYFGRVTPAAIVGNLFAVPLLALAMPALFASAVLSPWPSLASWPAGAAIVLLQGIELLAGLLSQVGWGSFEVARPGVLPALTYLVLLVMGAHAFHGAWQRRRFILVLGTAIAVSMMWPPLQRLSAPDGLTIYVFDVGQGDAIAIATPKRHWLLVDAGTKFRDFDAGARRVLPALREQGAGRLVAWLASHPDLDHVGGAPSVFDALTVDRVIGSGKLTGQAGQLAVLRWLADREVPWLWADEGTRLSVDEVDLVFLHPEKNSLASALESAPNEFSLVFLLEFGEFRMLFTGDVPGAVEDRLSRERPELLKAQVLKVSHHGSSSSTSRLFLSTVQPELAVISVGRGNRYGHPSPQVLARLLARNIAVRRTDRDGTLVIEAKRDGKWRVRSAAEGYW